ncbi:hypothetical protein [Schinkia azotoformans]|uniref:hypothetical protein n=1 Tax=Schinkia azotoformans TaxID=1454 RepID=UPI002DB8D097|nr:hypothetical protein [Schinkia azotoformans]MEC1778406.1 hypothetical protein [Schinkia azotoformans]MED4328349.1 hypothetical protein [Schinkia azotoformans]
MYKVLHTFYDKIQKVKYVEGEVYPKAGLPVDPARIAYLQENNPYKKAFISENIDENIEEKTVKETPKKNTTRRKKKVE